MSTYVIKQVRSANGTNAKQRDTLRSLGLRRIGHSVERPDSPQLRGMSVDRVLGLGGQNGTTSTVSASDDAEAPVEEPAEAPA